MDDSLRAQLHDLTLKARHLLVKEARELFEGVYDLSSTGTPLRESAPPSVQALEEARQTYGMLKRHLEDERSAGMSGAEAVEKLVKEVAFTHLNRLVAFKMMESRKLLRGTLDKYHESNAFKFYLAEHPEDEALYNAGSLPQDALGEGPRDTAYRRFLLAQCAEMAKQIRVLFDPDNLASQLFPRPRVLRELIEMLNAKTVSAAWEQDETIGWVYQDFNAEELEAAFREVRLSKKKFEAADIPAVTQLFTPRWVVKYLVQNTLGRLWLQMHPDPSLRESLDYLVPVNNAPVEAQRSVREITVLDPACGTMHFGLVAFDLLAEMYREEMGRAGEPGWPMMPSVAKTEDIPAAIIANNLFGIDIDLRAVQLSALTLLLKARSLNAKAVLTDHNLACADVLLPGEDRLTAFVQHSLQGRPVDQRLMRVAWMRLKDATQMGSLLRLDADLHEIIAEERRKYMQQMLPGLELQSFEGAASEQTFWSSAEERLTSAFDEFARFSAAEGRDERYFTAEAGKGLRVIGVMLRRYDVVVTNPPYLSSGNMNSQLRELVVKNYPAGKNDLYAAFLQRCIELASGFGHVGLLTMHSFMFISSFEPLREDIRKKVAIESLLHLGPALFDVGNPGTLQTAAYVMRRDAEAARRNDSVGVYARLLKEPNNTLKRNRFERALMQLKVQSSDPAIHLYRQGDFDVIEGGPFVYWITPNIRQIFVNFPKLREVARAVHGTKTYDNFRFVRRWWEVGISRVGIGLSNWENFIASDYSHVPYMKGGGFKRWYGNQRDVIQLVRGGMVFTSYLEEKLDHIRGIDFIFQEGIIYSHLSSSKISFRYMPRGFIFDQAGSGIFPNDMLYALGVLNSNFILYVKRLVNPTLNFMVGSLGIVPVPTAKSSILTSLVKEAVDLARNESFQQETSFEFVAPPEWLRGIEAEAARKVRISSAEAQIEDEVYNLYGIDDQDRANIEDELSSLPTSRDDGLEQGAGGQYEAPEDGDNEDGTLTVQELAQRWVSYAIGITFGRYQLGLEGAFGHGNLSHQVASSLIGLNCDSGITVVGDDHSDHLVPRVEQALELLLGPDETERALVAATGGKLLMDYVLRDFYKWHVQLYRKRPIYWMLQSPKRTYNLLAFHERLTRDSLYVILGPDYLGGAINAAQLRSSELRAVLQATPQGRERKRLEGELADAMAKLGDLEEFKRLITEVTTATNERGEVVGWQPEIDDGVLINLAPLHKLIPAWSAEPKKAWAALERGEYDWSHTAMRYWPDRVLKACENNKSYAIAHGLVTP